VLVFIFPSSFDWVSKANGIMNLFQTASLLTSPLSLILKNLKYSLNQHACFVLIARKNGQMFVHTFFAYVSSSQGFTIFDNSFVLSRGKSCVLPIHTKILFVSSTEVQCVPLSQIVDWGLSIIPECFWF